VLKRKGRMTRKQKLKRDKLEKAHKTDSKQTLNSVHNLLQGFKVAVGVSAPKLVGTEFSPATGGQKAAI